MSEGRCSDGLRQLAHPQCPIRLARLFGGLQDETEALGVALRPRRIERFRDGQLDIDDLSAPRGRSLIWVMPTGSGKSASDTARWS